MIPAQRHPPAAETTLSQRNRLERFRREHPHIVIITGAGLPKARVDGQEYTRATLRSLLDMLDELTGG